MNSEHHRRFGEIYNKMNDTDVDTFWTVAPDYKYYGWDDSESMLHRATLHFVTEDSMTDIIIDRYPDEIKDSDIGDIKKFIISHMYLDIFNSILVASLPKPRAELSFVKFSPLAWIKYYFKPMSKYYFDKEFIRLADKDVDWMMGEINYPRDELTFDIWDKFKKHYR